MDTAYLAGLIFGSLLVGALCGLIPLLTGLKKEKKGLAIGGFCACVVGGFIGGIIPSLLIAIIVLIIILVTASKDNLPRN